MQHYDDRIKLDKFKEETTYQNDYKMYNNYTCTKHKPQRARVEPEERPPPEYVYQDNETFLNWRKGVHIPFDLLWKPKPITGTNPHEEVLVPEVLEDTSKAEAIKTRPRIYMSPAVSVDDVADPEMRKLLCQYMYTTDWKKSTELSQVAISKKGPPSSTVEKPGDHVKFKCNLTPELPKTFRNRGIQWESEQKRGSVDPTGDFWIHKDPPVKCGACVNPIEGLIADDTKLAIQELIEKDKLRLAHDMPKPGYAGYQPRTSYGVPLSKVDLPVVHPFLSVSQATTSRYAEDNLNK